MPRIQFAGVVSGFLVACLIATAAAALAAAPVAEPWPLDDLYHRAQREYHRNNFDAALPLLERYLAESESKRYERVRLFWVIDQVGRILLRERRAPDAAIEFFSPLAKDNRLNEAEVDAVAGWLAAAQEWKNHGSLPSKGTTADELFERGQKYHRMGTTVSQFPGDDAGHAFFHIAATFLVPFIVNFDADRRIGEALYMMGDIRRQSRTDPSYWSHNNYLREAIRRFPHTPIARKAYKLLEQDVHYGYSGSSGNNTPRSLRAMLARLEKLAARKVRP